MVAPSHPVDDDHLPGLCPSGVVDELPPSVGCYSMCLMPTDRHLDHPHLRLSLLELFSDQHGSASNHDA